MQIKIHEAYRRIIAIADSSLIGKTYEDKNRQIEIKPDFFQGEEKTKEEIIEILKDMEKDDATFNIVGEEAVKAAIEARVISKNGVELIDGIPVALGLL